MIRSMVTADQWSRYNTETDEIRRKFTAWHGASEYGWSEETWSAYRDACKAVERRILAEPQPSSRREAIHAA